MLVSYICPICNMLIKSDSQNWQDRTRVESDNPNEVQYAHRKCVDKDG